uniref:Endonuclease/exonuclease/phosphatase domain-containing protein n=1 Tax=Cacopsylla melanoneura TaxID=428564 RepID=A0A8D8RLJ8_9HEMI
MIRIPTPFTYWLPNFTPSQPFNFIQSKYFNPTIPSSSTRVKLNWSTVPALTTYQNGRNSSSKINIYPDQTSGHFQPFYSILPPLDSTSLTQPLSGPTYLVPNFLPPLPKFPFRRSKSQKPPSALTVLHNNIQGLNIQKVPLIETFLSSLNVEHGLNPDILCFSESWLKLESVNFVNIPNFVNVSNYFRLNHIRGGVSIFVRSSLDLVPLSINLHPTDFSFEYCAVSSANLDIAVVCIYKSNNPLSNIDIFFEKLEELLSLLTDYRFLIICGDFNINTLVLNKTQTRLRALLNLFNLKACITSPTRISTIESCIDNIFINFQPKTLINNDFNIFSGLSDHQYSQVISFHTTSNKTEKVFGRTFGSRQINSFIKSLSEIDFSPVFQISNVNDQVNCFYDLFLRPFNLHFPFKISTIGGPKKKKWVTKGIACSCRHKRALFNLCRQTSNPIIHSHYKKYCKILNKVIRQSKRDYTLQAIKSAPKNKKSRVIWNIVRNFSKKNKTHYSQLKLKQEGKLIQNPELVADALNTFWINVADSCFASSSYLPHPPNSCSSLPPNSSSSSSLPPNFGSFVFYFGMQLSNNKTLIFELVPNSIGQKDTLPGEKNSLFTRKQSLLTQG